MNTLLITGGNEGIGYFMAKQWLENGNNVSVLDLNCENIGKLNETYPKTLLSFRCDIRDKESVKIAVCKTNSQFGNINYAVHNACLCCCLAR